MIRAVDPKLNRDAYGAHVSIWVGEEKQQRTVNPGFSYAASNDSHVHFGVGPAKRVDKIEIRWPGGVIQEFEGMEVNQHVILSKNAPTSESGR